MVGEGQDQGDDGLDDIEITLKPAVGDAPSDPPPTNVADAPLPAAGARPVALPPPTNVADAPLPAAGARPVALPPPGSASGPGFPQPAPAPSTAPAASSGHPWWWLAVAAGAAVVLGAFLPYLTGGGEGVSLIDGDWVATATVTVGALMVVGGLVGRVRREGMALAGGAGATWVGIFAVTLRPAVAAIQVADEFGGGADAGIGLVLWGAAAVAAVVVIVAGVGSLAGDEQPVWPFAVGAGGIGLFWVGLLVPPEGFEFGDHLFFGDTWMDAAVVLLLAGLPVAAVVLLVTRTAAGALFALGTAGAWMASWAVYAIDAPTSGGLPVPFPDAPAATSVAVAMISFTAIGALWWTAPTAAGGIGGTALAGGQLITIVVCAGSGLVGIAGIANSDGTGGADLIATAEPTPVYEDEFADPYVDEYSSDFSDEFSEDYYSDDFSDEFSDFSDEFSDDFSDDVQVTECVEVMCQPPAETWVVSLGSYFSEAEALAAYRTLPATGVLFTNEYASLNPNIWMVYYDGGYSSGEEAVQYCFEVGRTNRDLCFARRLSNDVGLDPNDPSLIVYPD